MTTKEQELKALTKIEAIVKELGEDSYVGWAMKGVADVARTNIECDSAFSLLDRAELAEKQVEELRITKDSLKGRIEELQASLKRVNEEANSTTASLLGALDGKDRTIRELEAKAVEAKREVRVDAGDEWSYFGPFKKIEFFRNEGSFPFVNVTEPSGWCRSYKMADIKELKIE